VHATSHPNKKTGNSELDLEQSLADLDLALEQQKLRKDKQEQLVKGLEQK